MNTLPLFLKRNSSTILSCIGAAGVIGTSVLAVKATPKALKICEELRKENDEPSKMDYVKATWKCYIPAAVIGLSTITCIFGANVLNKRTQAALTSAYMFLDNTYKEYRKKVKEIYGDDVDDRVRSKIVNDEYDQSINPLSADEYLFYEYNHGEFFERTRALVTSAEYNLNLKLQRKGSASLNDFYDFLELPRSEIGDTIGWCYGDGPNECLIIDFEHQLIELEDGMECHYIDIKTPPSICF